ncbi:MAG TPA: M3 family oligoendopeptidase [Anaerolineales bacterium]|nr:M3 family oligoendopeptidase [Anaerolineales bacterium]
MAFVQTHWNLGDLFTGYDSPELQAAFDNVEELVTSFEGARGGLQPDMQPEAFIEIVRKSEAIGRILSRIFGFAALSFAANTQDQAAQTLQARVDLFAAEMGNRTLFFSLWWKDVDEQNAQRLLDASGDYRYYLEQIRKFKPHTLTEPEEKIVNIKNVTGISALNTLYDAITNRYIYKLELDGETKELTLGELAAYRFSPDPDVRARSYQEQFRVFNADGPILGQMYQTIVRDWHNENISLRKYPSPISARNLSNDIPDEAVSALLGISEQNASIFQRYFRLKARHIGAGKLRRYDIYAPVTKSQKRYEFDEAANIVFDSFRSFDPVMSEMARRVFDQDHLDSEIRKGKDNGAFCASITPEMTPYVLLNYQGRPRDVAVMAHELGHAIHSMLATGHNLFTFQASLPLAETASTFGEMMLTDKLLSEESDESVRRELLFKQMDDAYATIMRQAYFALFEQKAHALIQEHASVDDLSTAYFDTLKQQFGDSLELGDEFRWEWVQIPHIYHVPFYVYAYAFGQLLVLSLYRQFKEEGEAFKPRYLKILAAGGSQAPAQILQEAGIDIRSEAFWQGGFDVLNKLENELEKLKP